MDGALFAQWRRTRVYGRRVYGYRNYGAPHLREMQWVNMEATGNRVNGYSFDCFRKEAGRLGCGSGDLYTGTHAKFSESV